MSGRVTVIGLDGRHLHPSAAQRLAAATLVVGGARHLEALELPENAERVVLGDLTSGLARLDSHSGAAVVLASGDPGFFGIVRQLSGRGLELDVVPAAGSVAAVCAKEGVSWDDAVVISAHGRGPLGLRRAVNACRALPKVAILTAPGSGPAELGAALAGSERRLIVGERLGSPSETVTRCTPAEAAARGWSDPNVVLVLGASSSRRGWAFPGRQSPAGWALPECDFEHRDAMVTKAEVRALALAQLGPGLGDLIWDLGAGSGSVGIECARFGAAVIAVDNDDAQCARVQRNAASLRRRCRTSPVGRRPKCSPDCPIRTASSWVAEGPTSARSSRRRRSGSRGPSWSPWPP